jgi:hypothetical protein
MRQLRETSEDIGRSVSTAKLPSTRLYGGNAMPVATAGERERAIAYRGSVTDLATDVAFELTAQQGKELIQELERFLSVEPAKFHAEPAATEGEREAADCTGRYGCPCRGLWSIACAGCCAVHHTRKDNSKTCDRRKSKMSEVKREVWIIEDEHGHCYGEFYDEQEPAEQDAKALIGARAVKYVPEQPALSSAQGEMEHRTRALLLGEEVTRLTESIDAPPRCRACGKDLTPECAWVADGCPCNSPRGVNHGLVPRRTCTCVRCDPEQTGSTRVEPPKPEGSEK